MTPLSSITIIINRIVIPKMQTRAPFILLASSLLSDKAKSLLPETKYPNKKIPEKKLMMLFTYLTSPYSEGIKKRVFNIETNTPNKTPPIVLQYKYTICFFDLLNTISEKKGKFSCTNYYTNALMKNALQLPIMSTTTASRIKKRVALKPFAPHHKQQH